MQWFLTGFDQSLKAADLYTV